MSNVHPSAFPAWRCLFALAAVLLAAAFHAAEGSEVETGVRPRERGQPSIVRSPRGPHAKHRTGHIQQVAMDVEPTGVSGQHHGHHRYRTFPQAEDLEADDGTIESASDATTLDTEVQREDIAEDVRAELEALESEDATLRAENVRLRHELSRIRTKVQEPTHSFTVEEEDGHMAAPAALTAKRHSQSSGVEMGQTADSSQVVIQATVTKPPVQTSHGDSAHHAAASGLKNKVDTSWTFDPSKCDADSNTHCTSWLRFCTCKNPEQGEEQSCHLYMPYVHKHCQTTCGKEGIRCPRATEGCSDSPHMLPANLSSNPPRLHSECHDWKHKKCPTTIDPDNNCGYCSPCGGNGWVKTVCKATCGLCATATGGTTTGSSLLQGEDFTPTCTEQPVTTMPPVQRS
mmetsp:Transcript_41312/g.74691  ORF Transcript_41312/g.74691 Transcript_41312/m.74691 type:complete len:401 (+) Transcript_41312:50-1252(+)